ncbi:MAG: hypothetical protein ACP5DY_07640 [Thermovirgaceae bacterium]
MKKFIALLMAVAFITIGGTAFAGGDQNCHDYNGGNPDGEQSGPTNSHQNSNSNPEDKPGP